MRDIYSSTVRYIETYEARRMTHSQESRVSSSQDTLPLREENRTSCVSKLVNGINACLSGGDVNANNETEKVEKMADTSNQGGGKQSVYPWLSNFRDTCRAGLGCKSMKKLEMLMTSYLGYVSETVKGCYTRPNRAAKLRKCMNETLLYFHMYFQDVRKAGKRSVYLDLMTGLVSMYMDMEIKAACRQKEKAKKITSRLTSALYLFLDKSEDHVLDAILKAKLINIQNRAVCLPMLGKIVNQVPQSLSEMSYVRYLLIYKLFKNIIPSSRKDKKRKSEEEERINKLAILRLKPPDNFVEKAKIFTNVLPKIPPKSKKKITHFYMQAKINLSSACGAFLKDVKEFQDSLYGSTDKELFCSKQLSVSPVVNDKADGAAGTSNGISSLDLVSLVQNSQVNDLTSSKDAGGKKVKEKMKDKKNKNIGAKDKKKDLEKIRKKKLKKNKILGMCGDTISMLESKVLGFKKGKGDKKKKKKIIVDLTSNDSTDESVSLPETSSVGNLFKEMEELRKISSMSLSSISGTTGTNSSSEESQNFVSTGMLRRQDISNDDVIDISEVSAETSASVLRNEQPTTTVSTSVPAYKQASAVGTAGPPRPLSTYISALPPPPPPTSSLEQPTTTTPQGGPPLPFVFPAECMTGLRPNRDTDPQSASPAAPGSHVSACSSSVSPRSIMPNLCASFPVGFIPSIPPPPLPTYPPPLPPPPPPLPSSSAMHAQVPVSYLPLQPPLPRSPAPLPPPLPSDPAPASSSGFSFPVPPPHYSFLSSIPPPPAPPSALSHSMPLHTSLLLSSVLGVPRPPPTPSPTHSHPSSRRGQTPPPHTLSSPCTRPTPTPPPPSTLSPRPARTPPAGHALLPPPIPPSLPSSSPLSTSSTPPPSVSSGHHPLFALASTSPVPCAPSSPAPSVARTPPPIAALRVPSAGTPPPRVVSPRVHSEATPPRVCTQGTRSVASFPRSVRTPSPAPASLSSNPPVSSSLMSESSNFVTTQLSHRDSPLSPCRPETPPPRAHTPITSLSPRTGSSKSASHSTDRTVSTTPPPSRVTPTPPPLHAVRTSSQAAATPPPSRAAPTPSRAASTPPPSQAAATQPLSSAALTPPPLRTARTPPPSQAAPTQPLSPAAPSRTAPTPPPSRTALTPPPSQTASTPPISPTACTPPSSRAAPTPPPSQAAPTPPPSQTAPTPPPSRAAPTPPPSRAASTPPPSRAAPTPPPSRAAPTPLPSRAAPTPPPSQTAPTPPPSQTAPTPSLSQAAPTPPPSRATPTPPLSQAVPTPPPSRATPTPPPSRAVPTPPPSRAAPTPPPSRAAPTPPSSRAAPTPPPSQAAPTPPPSQYVPTEPLSIAVPMSPSRTILTSPLHTVASSPCTVAPSPSPSCVVVSQSIACAVTSPLPLHAVAFPSSLSRTVSPSRDSHSFSPQSPSPTLTPPPSLTPVPSSSSDSVSPAPSRSPSPSPPDSPPLLTSQSIPALTDSVLAGVPRRSVFSPAISIVVPVSHSSLSPASPCVASPPLSMCADEAVSVTAPETSPVRAPSPVPPPESSPALLAQSSYLEQPTTTTTTTDAVESVSKITEVPIELLTALHLQKRKEHYVSFRADLASESAIPCFSSPDVAPNDERVVDVGAEVEVAEEETEAEVEADTLTPQIAEESQENIILITNRVLTVKEEMVESVSEERVTCDSAGEHLLLTASEVCPEENSAVAPETSLKEEISYPEDQLNTINTVITPIPQARDTVIASGSSESIKISSSGIENRCLVTSQICKPEIQGNEAMASCSSEQEKDCMDTVSPRSVRDVLVSERSMSKDEDSDPVPFCDSSIPSIRLCGEGSPENNELSPDAMEVDSDPEMMVPFTATQVAVQTFSSNDDVMYDMFNGGVGSVFFGSHNLVLLDSSNQEPDSPPMEAFNSNDTRTFYDIMLHLQGGNVDASQYGNERLDSIVSMDQNPMLHNGSMVGVGTVDEDNVHDESMMMDGMNEESDENDDDKSYNSNCHVQRYRGRPRTAGKRLPEEASHGYSVILDDSKDVPDTSPSMSVENDSVVSSPLQPNISYVASSNLFSNVNDNIDNGTRLINSSDSIKIACVGSVGTPHSTTPKQGRVNTSRCYTSIQQTLQSSSSESREDSSAEESPTKIVPKSVEETPRSVVRFNTLEVKIQPLSVSRGNPDVVLDARKADARKAEGQQVQETPKPAQRGRRTYRGQGTARQVCRPAPEPVPDIVKPGRGRRRGTTQRAPEPAKRGRGGRGTAQRARGQRGKTSARSVTRKSLNEGNRRETRSSKQNANA